MSAKRVAAMVLIVLCAAGAALAQTVWTDVPNLQGLEPGPLGSWDEGGCMVLAVVSDGSTYHLWYEGLSADGYWRDIGHATSPDRVTWTKAAANPVLTSGGAPGGWDDDGVSGAAVIWDGAQFRMWYGGLSVDGVERACYATSPDGEDWTKHACNLPGLEPGVPGLWDLDTVRPTSVVIVGNTYRMWYTGMRYLGGTSGWSGVVGYAESLDGLSWTKRSDPVLEPGDGTWEERMTFAPYVVFDSAGYHMFYTGGTEVFPSTINHSLGYAFSADGIHWNKSGANPVIAVDGEFALFSPVHFDGGTWYMWYSRSTNSGSLPLMVSHAISTCCEGLFGDGFETGDTSLWTTTVP